MHYNTDTGQPTDPSQLSRASRVLARLRQRQLDMARTGRIHASARYAQYARRVKRSLCGTASSVTLAG
jgi:hypothetical protein